MPSSIQLPIVRLFQQNFWGQREALPLPLHVLATKAPASTVAQCQAFVADTF